MPKRGRSRYEKIKRKLRKLESMIADSSSSESDSDSSSENERQANAKLRHRYRVSDVSSSDGREPDKDLQNIRGDRLAAAAAPDRDVSCLLGPNPSGICTTGPPLEPQLVSRWTNYLSAGLDKETRDRIGRGLSVLGVSLNSILTEDIPDEIRNKVLPGIVDAGRLFCETHHLLSVHRRHQVLPFLNRVSQKVAETDESKIGTFLFGPNFAERCKTAHSVQRASYDMRKKSSSTQQFQEKTNYLNSQRPLPNTKMKPYNRVHASRKNHNKETSNNRKKTTYVPRRRQ